MTEMKKYKILCNMVMFYDDCRQLRSFVSSSFFLYPSINQTYVASSTSSAAVKRGIRVVLTYIMYHSLALVPRYKLQRIYPV
jgi:hypothetical protein